MARSCAMASVSKDGGGPDRGGLMLRDASQRPILCKRHRRSRAAMLLSMRPGEAALTYAKLRR